MRINGSRFERALDVTLLEELFLAVAVKLKRLKKSAFCWNYLAVRLLIKRGIDVQHVLGAIQSVKLSTSGLLYFFINNYSYTFGCLCILSTTRHGSFAMDRVSYSVHSDIYSIDGVWSSIRLTIVVLDFFAFHFVCHLF